MTQGSNAHAETVRTLLAGYEIVRMSSIAKIATQGHSTADVYFISSDSFFTPYFAGSVPWWGWFTRFIIGKAAVHGCR
jgi:hypothetical protein